MIATFPHMGNMYIAIKELFRGLKLEMVPPPPVSKRTLELGVKYSPEFACLPLKINVGNFIEAMEKGADTVVMGGGWGPCRFGYFAQVEREILKDLGFNFTMVVLEAPDSRLSDLLQQIKALGENVSISQAYKALKFAWDKLKAVEVLEKALEFCLPRAADKDLVEKYYEQGLQAIDKLNNRKDLAGVTTEADRAIRCVAQREDPVLKIGLVGEIYTILEPSINCHIARHLGRINAEVSRSIYLTDWVNDHILGGWVKRSNHRYILQSSQPYLNYAVGGHGRETVGNSVDFARRGYDGIIQIGPLTCMPEIVAQSVLGRVSRELQVPCMTMYFDEHSGTAGVYTRLEAFVDMLARRKRLAGGAASGAPCPGRVG
ncbi:MAG: CoA protein activase [Syntrophomonadaceae bacterium]